MRCNTGMRFSKLLKNCFSISELTSAAKAATDLAAFTARLEAASLQNKAKFEFFSSLLDFSLPLRSSWENAMRTNAFIGVEREPTDEALSKALGPAKTLWNRLLAKLHAEKLIDSEEWNSYSRKAGWSLKLKQGGRTIVYLSPGNGCFRASFVLGDRAVKAVLAAKLPADVVKIVRQAKHYAEGSAVRIEVRAAKDLDVVKTLATAKLAN